MNSEYSLGHGPVTFWNHFPSCSGRGRRGSHEEVSRMEFSSSYHDAGLRTPCASRDYDDSRDGGALQGL